MADDRQADEELEGMDDGPHDSDAQHELDPGDDMLADDFATNFGSDVEADTASLSRPGPRFDDDSEDDSPDDDDDYDDDDDDSDDGYDGDEDEDDEEGWGGNTGLIDGVEEEGTFACPSCGEEIVIPIDISEGSEQELTEDCPVCCNPNVITITIDDAGDITVEAESESD